MGYDRTFTDALQFVWGEGFLSPGGPEELAAILDGLDLDGRRVLDIGCGLGGYDLLIAERGAGEVIGIDVDPFLLGEAERLVAGRGLGDQVRLRRVDPGPLPFPPERFDLVFSKDALVHVPDKPALYRDVLRVLAPGGVFAASDWLFCAGAGQSPVVRDWLAMIGLDFAFTTPEQAAAELERAGFVEVSLVNRNRAIAALNRKEVAMLAGPGGRDLAERVGEAFAAKRLESARARLGVLEGGFLLPSHLRAVKRR